MFHRMFHRILLLVLTAMKRLMSEITGASTDRSAIVLVRVRPPEQLLADVDQLIEWLALLLIPPADRLEGRARG